MVKDGLIIYGDKCKCWFKDNQYHRLNGPAIQYDGYKGYFQNGKYHRLDGPARDWVSGSKFWFYDGKHIECTTQEEFERIIKLRLLW